MFSTSSKQLSTYLQEKRLEVEQKLEMLVPVSSLPYKKLYDAARYALLNGGKRLRPLLTIATTELLHGSTKNALTSACAIELVHTYSLIHDDLPCMDDDDFRRGKPSLHKAFTEAHAVLTGDYLLTYAFEVIAQDEFLRNDQKVALIALLAKNSGDKGMIAGQVMDIEAEGLSIDLNHLIKIHSLKTGALITAAIEFGAIIADATQEQINHLRHFGNDVGLAYQIIDDIIDVYASEEKHGKKIASDAINNKTTYVTLLGVECAQKTADELLQRALIHLEHLPYDTDLLADLAKMLIHRKI